MKYILYIALFTVLLTSCSLSNKKEINHQKILEESNLEEYREAETMKEKEPVYDNESSEYPKILNPETKKIELAFQAEDIFCIYTGEKFGFFNEDGNQLTPFIYDFAYPFSEGLACVMKDGKYGFIDKKGNVCIPLLYDKSNSFSEGLAYYEIEDRYGFINKRGEEVIKLDCDSISSFQEGRAFFSLDGKYGFIDNTGKVIIDCIYDDVSYFDHGLAIVRKGILCGAIDIFGNEKIPLKYDSIKMNEKYIEAYKDSDTYTFDLLGNSILNDYHLAYIYDSYIIFQSGEKFGVLDINENIVVNAIYDSINLIENKNLFIVSQSEKYGIIDSQGATKVSLQYDNISLPYLNDLEPDYVTIRCEDKSGILSLLDFTVTISPTYDSIYPFYEGYAIVYENSEYGLVDKIGNIVIPFAEYDYIFSVYDSLLCLEKNNKYYLAKNNGEKISSDYFDDINQFSKAGDYQIFKKNGKEGLLDKNGDVVIDAIYDYISGYYNEVYGSNTSFLTTKYDAENRNSIIIVDAYNEIDLTEITLINEITPRIKSYHDLTVKPAISFSEIANYNIITAKLFKVDGYEEPILYYYEKPAERMNFPMSDSVFYGIENGEAKAIVSGYECGGSMRGDYVQLYFEKETSKILLGTRGFWGGFGGYASDYRFYRNNEEFLFLCWIDQTSKNYDENYLLENASFLYNENVSYNKENILEAESIEEYLLNNETVKQEVFDYELDKYIIIPIMR